MTDTDTLREALASLDQAEKDCPANRSHLGDKPCPKCRATTSDSCREQDIAARGVVTAARKARAILSKPEPAAVGEEEIEALCERIRYRLVRSASAVAQQLGYDCIDTIRRLYASPVPSGGADDWLTNRVAEVVEEDGGCWTACSGCQESVDGYVSSKHYPYNPIFKCQPGSGCRECGGIGVVWQDGDFLASYGDALSEETSPSEAISPPDAPSKPWLQDVFDSIKPCPTCGKLGDALKFASPPDARAVVEACAKIDQQADCLDHYAEMSGFKKEPLPSVFHLQSSHFRDIANDLRAALQSGTSK